MKGSRTPKLSENKKPGNLEEVEVKIQVERFSGTVTYVEAQKSGLIDNDIRFDWQDLRYKREAVQKGDFVSFTIDDRTRIPTARDIVVEQSEEFNGTIKHIFRGFGVLVPLEMEQTTKFTFGDRVCPFGSNNVNYEGCPGTVIHVKNQVAPPGHVFVQFDEDGLDIIPILADSLLMEASYETFQLERPSVQNPDMPLLPGDIVNFQRKYDPEEDVIKATDVYLLIPTDSGRLRGTLCIDIMEHGIKNYIVTENEEYLAKVDMNAVIGSATLHNGDPITFEIVHGIATRLSLIRQPTPRARARAPHARQPISTDLSTQSTDDLPELQTHPISNLHRPTRHAIELDQKAHVSTDNNLSDGSDDSIASATKSDCTSTTFSDRVVIPFAHLYMQKKDLQTGTLAVCSNKAQVDGFRRKSNPMHLTVQRSLKNLDRSSGATSSCSEAVSTKEFRISEFRIPATTDALNKKPSGSSFVIWVLLFVDVAFYIATSDVVGLQYVKQLVPLSFFFSLSRHSLNILLICYEMFSKWKSTRDISELRIRDWIDISRICLVTLLASSGLVSLLAAGISDDCPYHQNVICWQFHINRSMALVNIPLMVADVIAIRTEKVQPSVRSSRTFHMKFSYCLGELCKNMLFVCLWSRSYVAFLKFVGAKSMALSIGVPLVFVFYYRMMEEYCLFASPRTDEERHISSGLNQNSSVIEISGLIATVFGFLLVFDWLQGTQFDWALEIEKIVLLGIIMIHTMYTLKQESKMYPKDYATDAREWTETYFTTISGAGTICVTAFMFPLGSSLFAENGSAFLVLKDVVLAMTIIQIIVQFVVARRCAKIPKKKNDEFVEPLVISSNLVYVYIAFNVSFLLIAFLGAPSKLIEQIIEHSSHSNIAVIAPHLVYQAIFWMSIEFRMTSVVCFLKLVVSSIRKNEVSRQYF